MALNHQYMVRFIPTCMGNSPISPPRPRTSSVHPHVHGELIDAVLGSIGMHGSSPRAWGTRPLCRRRGDVCRFIPTCMGNSLTKAVKENTEAVHPHVHGELFINQIIYIVAIGSSPRAWGTRARRDQTPHRDRFIPTCMGNSDCISARQRSASVHPHVHGELICNCSPYSNSSGSSPRAWGTPRPHDRRPRSLRFIPTCMGNSKYMHFTI